MSSSRKIVAFIAIAMCSCLLASCNFAGQFIPPGKEISLAAMPLGRVNLVEYVNDQPKVEPSIVEAKNGAYILSNGSDTTGKDAPMRLRFTQVGNSMIGEGVVVGTVSPAFILLVELHPNGIAFYVPDPTRWKSLLNEKAGGWTLTKKQEAYDDRLIDGDIDARYRIAVDIVTNHRDVFDVDHPSILEIPGPVTAAPAAP